MSTEICPICQDSLEGDLYTLPECNHTFHTNCIMTWFRAPTGNNKCPLCNDSGINKLQDLNIIGWYSKTAALENYNTVRTYSRRKEAPKELKRMVARLKNIEIKKKMHVDEFKLFKKNKHGDLTGQEVHRKYCLYRRKKWGMDRRIRRHKMLIGFQNFAKSIIIPVKENVA